MKFKCDSKKDPHLSIDKVYEGMIKTVLIKDDRNEWHEYPFYKFNIYDSYQLPISYAYGHPKWCLYEGDIYKGINHNYLDYLRDHIKETKKDIANLLEYEEFEDVYRLSATLKYLSHKLSWLAEKEVLDKKHEGTAYKVYE